MWCESPCWLMPGAPSSESSALRSQPPAGGSPPRSPSPSLWPASGLPQPAGFESSELGSPPRCVSLPVREGGGRGEREDGVEGEHEGLLGRVSVVLSGPAQCF